MTDPGGNAVRRRLIEAVHLEECDAASPLQPVKGVQVGGVRPGRRHRVELDRRDELTTEHLGVEAVGGRGIPGRISDVVQRQRTGYHGTGSLLMERRVTRS